MMMPARIMVIMPLSNLEYPTRSFGGVDSICQMHLDALLEDKDGREYLIVAFNPANDTSEQGREQSLASHVKAVLYDLNGTDGIWRYLPNVFWQNSRIEKHISGFRPHIIHTHIPAWKPFISRNAKKVTTLHAAPGASRASLGRLNSFIFETVFPKLSTLTSDRITTVSIDEYERLSRRGHRHLELIPNGISPVYLNTSRQDRTGQSTLNFCITGSVIEGKRPHVAIEAIASRLTELKNIQLSIIGPTKNQKYLDRIKIYASKFSSPEKTIFLGNKSASEIVELYESAFCGLFLSANETFGLAPLEMLAAGLPLISTPVGIMKWERQTFEELGVRYVEIDDVEGTAEAIIEMIRTPPAEETRQRAKQFVAENFSAQSACNRYIRLYERLGHSL